MMRSKTATSMQKTYDDCYLVCSTACYFESQNNEAEALRSWRDALDQIYYQNAYKLPSGWKPRTETEKALYDSLRVMEKQCKERVDLLEALRDSRKEAQDAKDANEAKRRSANEALTPTPTHDPNAISPRPALSTHASDRSNPTGRYLGDGITKPVDYHSIPRLPSTLPAPRRPPEKTSLFSWQRSKTDTASQPAAEPGPSSASLAAPSLAPYTTSSTVAAITSTTANRTPSPEKKSGMLRTLRTGTKKNASTKMLNSLRNKQPAAAAKAATQAWSNIAHSQNPTGNSIDALNASASSLALTSPESRAKFEHQSHASPALSRTASEAAMQISADRSARSSVPDPNGSKRAPYPEDNTMPRLAPRRSFADADHLSISAIMHGSKADRATSQPGSPVVPNGTWQRSPASSNHSKQDVSMPAYRKEYPTTDNHLKPSSASSHKRTKSESSPLPSNSNTPTSPPTKSPLKPSKSPMRSPMKPAPPPVPRRKAVGAVASALARQKRDDVLVTSGEESSGLETNAHRRARKTKSPVRSASPSSPDSYSSDFTAGVNQAWKQRVAEIMAHLPTGVDEVAAQQILNEIVIQGDEVHWDDVAGLEIAKSALKETVVYPFLRPDLFMGLREPARGMLLFGPPGTGKTMLARAVATESKSTFFAISASSLTSKFLGESEKLVRALFGLAKVLAPSIIFVDEIDSLLSSRGGGSEHEATRRIKTEFLIQWSDLAKAAAGRETSDKDRLQGDATRVLVLAATNLPWAIDEAARRRFVRRQYIPLPEGEVRKKQLRTLLSHQKQAITEKELDCLVGLTDGYSGSDITALAKDAAMGPLRSLGENLLHMSSDEIRAIEISDFESSLVNIRPSVGKDGLKEYEEWAKNFGERGG